MIGTGSSFLPGKGELFMSIGRFGIWTSGPLAGFAEGYGTELTQLGYAPASVRLQLKVLADLSDWLLSQGMAAADLRRSDLDRFLRHRRAAGSTRYASIRAVRPSFRGRLPAQSWTRLT